MVSPLQSVQHHVCQSVGEIWDTAITDLKTMSCLSVAAGVSLQAPFSGPTTFREFPIYQEQGDLTVLSAIASS
jgi:hypothetical protein